MARAPNAALGRGLAALGVSLVAHGLAVAGTGWLPSPSLALVDMKPDLELDFAIETLPPVDEAPAETPAPAEAPQPAPAASQDTTDAPSEKTRTAQAKRRPASFQAPVEGHTVALRFNMRAIRRSELADAVSKTLPALPDWVALLGGSGVDPVAHVDELLIASPDLRRAKTLVAGRSTLPALRLRGITAEFAALRGASQPTWRREAQAQVAAWPNQDRTAREIAVRAPSTFVIAAKGDTGVGLALLSHKAEGAQPGPLDMPRAALAALRMDDASKLLRFRGLATPQQIFLALRKQRKAYLLDGQASFPSRAERDAALAQLRTRLARLLGNPLVRFTGWAGTLTKIALKARGATRVELRLPLERREVERLLRFAPQVRRRPAK